MPLIARTVAVGSTIAVTDQGQNIVNKYSYEPFGTIESQTELLPQPFKYVGQYGVMAEDNGLYYMRARHYDPKVGRFISEDPIGFEGGTVNLSEYVGNDPVNKIDPEGLQGNIPLGNGYTARVDQFNTSTGASHEIHVFSSQGKEIGIFGPNGWIKKHGFVEEPKNIPKETLNKLNGVNVALLRKQGKLPPKGSCNIKGGRYMKGASTLGWLLMFLDALDAQSRAEQSGKSIWHQMLEDMYGDAISGDSVL